MISEAQNNVDILATLSPHVIYILLVDYSRIEGVKGAIGGDIFIRCTFLTLCKGVTYLKGCLLYRSLPKPRYFGSYHGRLRKVHGMWFLRDSFPEAS